MTKDELSFSVFMGMPAHADQGNNLLIGTERNVMILNLNFVRFLPGQGSLSLLVTLKVYLKHCRFTPRLS